MLQFTQMGANDEAVLEASDLSLPIVHRVATVFTQSASRISWHQHPFVEIVVVVGGATSYEFRDGRRFDLTGGQFLVIPPGAEHRGLNDVRSPARMSGIMINPRCRSPRQNTGLSAPDVKKILTTLDVSDVRAATCGAILMTLVRHLHGAIRAVKEQQEFSQSHLRLLLCQILIELATRTKSSVSAEPLKLIDAAVNYMRLHQSDEHSIVELVRHLRCSRAQLFKVFKGATGMTPNDYWQRLRIESAQKLLRSTERSITAVAIACGFSTSQYFSSVFRKYVGVSPKEYRLLESKNTLTKT